MMGENRVPHDVVAFAPNSTLFRDAANYGDSNTCAASNIRSGRRTDCTVAVTRSNLRFPIFAVLEHVDLDPLGERVDNPVLGHPVAREPPHLPSTIRRGAGRREHLDHDVRCMPGHGVGP